MSPFVTSIRVRTKTSYGDMYVMDKLNEVPLRESHLKQNKLFPDVDEQTLPKSSSDSDEDDDDDEIFDDEEELLEEDDFDDDDD